MIAIRGWKIIIGVSSVRPELAGDVVLVDPGWNHPQSLAQNRAVSRPALTPRASSKTQAPGPSPGPAGSPYYSVPSPRGGLQRSGGSGSS